jgi:hypothetical protein
VPRCIKQRLLLAIGEWQHIRRHGATLAFR